jgi:hypothetical protein
MLTQEEDQQLVERVQRGDKRAFDLLVLKYQHKILGLIVRFVHDTHEAQDVAQEAFIKAYTRQFSRRQRVLYVVVPYRHQHGEKLSGVARSASTRQ